MIVWVPSKSQSSTFPEQMVCAMHYVREYSDILGIDISSQTMLTFPDTGMYGTKVLVLE